MNSSSQIASTGNADSSLLVTKVEHKDTTKAPTAANAAARKAAKAKKDAAQAEKDAAREADQVEKRMNAGLAARPGSRARTNALEEYYSAARVQAREENAAARRKAGHFGHASK
jgi:hypothetical protein